MLLSTVEGTKLFIHYIEESTAQLVKHKALNLVDVDSSPMMGVTSYDVIFIEVYIKSQLNIILLSRPLGATHHCSNLHDYTYKVPAHYCIMTRPLGATLVEVFMSIRKLQVPGCCKHDNPALGGYIVWSIQFLLVTGMNNMDFFLSGSIYIEASLKPSLCSAQDLGATGIILLSKNYFQILCFEQTGLTRRHQSL